MAGRFPQVTGLRFGWDAAAPAGQRLGPVEVRREGQWEPLDPARVYRVVTNDFQRRGGNGYAMLRDAALEEVVAAFLAASPRPQLEGRIGGR